MHIEGKPYERGIQHGRLLAAEIAAHVRCLAACAGPKDPLEAWKHVRNLANALFLRGYDREQLEEMKGIADGASAAGATFEGRSIDLVDIVAINSPNELESLEGALEATPTGLEGMTDPKKPTGAVPRRARRSRPTRCTAFAAIGPATRDGKIVFGHITMWELYPANFYNVWLDLKPDQGHHFVMQTCPGGMHSGMDYSISDAGIMMSETTLEQTRFNLRGIPLSARIRRAVQYANSIEETSEILRRDSNGLSTNEWILADVKRNEIALFTLGTHQSKLYRSSKNEWIDGAKGFYWSCNNNKDMEVRMETIAGVEGRPSAMAAFAPCNRDTIWLRMYERFQGKIDADFGRMVVTSPSLVGPYSVDAKYTTSDLAGQFKTWATFGPPLGPSWEPTFTERKNFPEVRPLVPNPWVVLHAVAPPQSEESSMNIADLLDPEDSELSPLPRKGPEKDSESDRTAPAAWHGTLLPKSDAEIWLTTAFANYERIVAQETLLGSAKKGHKSSDLDELGLSVFYYRSVYELGARAGEDIPLSRTQSNRHDDNWYKVASGKGVLLLHSLRGLLGTDDFDRFMDEFGRAHAGSEVTVAQFQTYLEIKAGRSLQAFFDPWLNRTGLPRLELGECETHRVGKKWTTTVTLGRDKAGPSLTVPITVETEKAEATQQVHLEKRSETIRVTTEGQPIRIVVDKHGLAARSNGGPFNILTFETELEQALIVYGTLDEASANREAAHKLQEALRRREFNITIPIKRDDDVIDNDLKNHHLVLIGRPDSNRLVARFREALPIRFGPHSFEVRGEAYAHAETAVLMAAENPLNKRYSMIVIAGLSGLATLQTVPRFEDESLTYAEVVILPYNRDEVSLVMPPKELVRELRRDKPEN